MQVIENSPNALLPVYHNMNFFSRVPYNILHI
ncbi:hypothetical protein GPNCGGLF_LOCUS4290 [Methylorubrum aminovorans]